MSANHNGGHRILSIINSVSETLSMSNQRQQLTEMLLDTICQEFTVDCCWVQLFSPESRELTIVAQRGFTQDMRQEIDSIGASHGIASQVAGLGYRVVITDLPRDREYTLMSFSQAGIHSIVAVPVRTYHTQGILGVASRATREFNSETAELLDVVASLLGVALDKADLYQRTLSREKELSTDMRQLARPPVPDENLHQDLVKELQEVEELARAEETVRKTAYEAKEPPAPVDPPIPVPEISYPVVPKKVEIKGKVKVFIIDRDTLFRQGLSLYLSQSEDITVVGESDDFVADVVAIALSMAPDVVLLDADLPSLNGLTLTREINRRSPATAIIMLTPYEDDNHVFQALRAGIVAYLSKDMAGDGLATIIRRVAKGEYIVDGLLARPAVAVQALKDFRIMEKQGTSPLGDPEIQILTYFAGGYSRKQVSHTTGVSEHELSSILGYIASKLAASASS